MYAMLVALLAASADLRAQKLEVVPDRVMVDQSATIRATGLQPNERVTIRADLIDGADSQWGSQAEFIADAQGVVDTSQAAPVAGSYKKDASAMGLVWSMMPSSRKEARYQPPRGSQTIDFQLLRGNTQLGMARLEQAPAADGVQRIILREGRLRGTLSVPPGSDKHPGVLVLGGSEGGLPVRRAAWFASHGYAALALAYFRYDDLPRELAAIPLEYFGSALNWMAHRPEIASDRIAVSGVSRGGELALQLGSMYPVIKAVAAYVPANVRYPACCGFTSVPFAWTWNGNALAFHRVRGGDTDLRSAIEVERTQGPVLLVCGGEDGVWPSCSMTDSVVARLRRARFAYNVVSLKYPQAGHTAGRPEIVPDWMGRGVNPVSGREVDPGGTAKGNAESSLDAIPKVLDFLQQSLSGR